MIYKQRQPAAAFGQARAEFPAVLLTEPLQSGKTTFLRHEAGADIDYMSFDDPFERAFAEVDPTEVFGRVAGKLLPIEIKLTATAGIGHIDPLERFLAIAAAEAARPGLLVCRTPKARTMPHGHMALPWGAFPQWLLARL